MILLWFYRKLTKFKLRQIRNLNCQKCWIVWPAFITKLPRQNCLCMWFATLLWLLACLTVMLPIDNRTTKGWYLNILYQDNERGFFDTVTGSSGPIWAWFMEHYQRLFYTKKMGLAKLKVNKVFKREKHLVQNNGKRNEANFYCSISTIQTTETIKTRTTKIKHWALKHDILAQRLPIQSCTVIFSYIISCLCLLYSLLSRYQ